MYQCFMSMVIQYKKKNAVEEAEIIKRIYIMNGHTNLTRGQNVVLNDFFKLLPQSPCSAQLCSPPPSGLGDWAWRRGPQSQDTQVTLCLNLQVLHFSPDLLAEKP